MLFRFEFREIIWQANGRNRQLADNTSSGKFQQPFFGGDKGYGFIGRNGVGEKYRTILF